MATGKMCRAARALLGISQADLAHMSGVSLARVTAFENGADCLTSTVQAIIGVLHSQGAVFGSDDSVRVVPKGSNFIVEPGQNPTAEELQGAVKIIVAWEKSKTPRGGLG